MTKLSIHITGNTLTISDGALVLYQVKANKIIHHSKTFPQLVDQNGRDWSKDIREASEGERPEFRTTYSAAGPDLTIDLFTVDDYVVVREGPIIRFQMQANFNSYSDHEGVYDDGWDPLVEAIEFTLHKKGNYQYIENHNFEYGRDGDLLRIDLDSGDRVNISELERTIKTRKEAPKKQDPNALGCCGCAVILFILFLLLGLLGQ